VDETERARRLSLLYDPYHAAVDAMLKGAVRAAPPAAPPVLVVSVHSFTPLYEGSPRAVEVGVLFNETDTLAVPVRG
jgi:predicted N-formylglutamate amidohydrolase